MGMGLSHILTKLSSHKNNPTPNFWTGQIMFRKGQHVEIKTLIFYAAHALRGVPDAKPWCPFVLFQPDLSGIK
jgi:hypothetical protein